MATKEYTDNLVTDLNGAVYQIVNPTNSDSSLTANTTEFTNGTTPFNMNAQLITSLANATVDTDALNR